MTIKQSLVLVINFCLKDTTKTKIYEKMYLLFSEFYFFTINLIYYKITKFLSNSYKSIGKVDIITKSFDDRFSKV